MPVVFFLRQFLADMIDLAGVGSVTDESSAVKFILQHPLYSRVLPQEAVSRQYISLKIPLKPTINSSSSLLVSMFSVTDSTRTSCSRR